ncbi:MAG: ATP-binding protein [Bacteroidales bacterium]|nr:ATP-binding protein [Bacteroidales bacterium]
MKESLLVKNVGALRMVNLKELKPLTVLIGASASGKSTLMKIIALMRYIYKRVNIKAYLKNSQIDGAIFYIRFQDLLKDGMKDLFNKESEIEYSVETNGRRYLISYKDGKLNTAIDIPDEDLLFFKEAWVSEMRSVIPVWASRGSLVKGSSFGFYFDETFSDFDEATDVVKDIDLDYLDMKLEVVKGGNNQKKYLVSPKDGSYAPVELKFASSGTQTTAPLVTLMKYFANDFSFKEAMRRSIILMLFDKNLTEKYHPGIELGNLPKYVHIHAEEPELSLDPRSQRRLVDSMMRYIFHECEKEREMGLVLATHSPYIINHLNVLLRASYTDNGRKIYPYINPDNLAAYKVTDGGLMDLMATEEDSDQMVINTLDLSEIMEDIYNDYEALSGEEL